MPIRTSYNNAAKRNRLVPVYRGSGRIIFLIGHSRKPGSRKNQFFKLTEEVPLLLINETTGERVRAVWSVEDNDYIPVSVANERKVAKEAEGAVVADAKDEHNHAPGEEATKEEA